MIGGTGDDTLHGGTHADNFAFYADIDEGTDVILDFELAVDDVLIADVGEYTLTDNGTDTLMTFAIGGSVTIENMTGWATQDEFITNVMT